MLSITETALKFRIAQLEGKLSLYEDLIDEIVKIESIQKSTTDIKRKLEDISIAWEGHIATNG